MGSFKNLFSRSRKLKFTQKLPDIVRIQFCTNHGPRGSDEATLGKTILHVSILEKIFKKSSSPESAGQFQPNHIQIIHK
jgi:hypothetical protein